MKKMISALVVAVCLLAAVPAQAQLRWGVKVGTNLNKMKLKSGTANVKADNMTGFFVGPMADFTIPLIGLGVDGSLLYSQKGVKVNGEKNRQHLLEIPVNLKYSVGMGDMASVFVAAGPDFSFNLKSDRLWSDVKRKKADVAINVGLGLKLINHLQVAANYSIPLTNSFGDSVSGLDYTAKNRTWQISLAYMF